MNENTGLTMKYMQLESTVKDSEMTYVEMKQFVFFKYNRIKKYSYESDKSLSIYNNRYD